MNEVNGFLTRNSSRAAPKARNMIARGKREARRPWLEKNKFIRALKVRNIYSALSELHGKFYFTQGRRASRCSALAPGCHIPRLRRSAD